MAKGFNKGPQMGGGQAGMMQQLQKMQQQMAEAQEKLAVATVTATAGGGAIKVVMLKSLPISSKTPMPKCCRTWSCPL